MDIFPDEVNYEIVKKMNGKQLMNTYINCEFLRKFITPKLVRIAQFRGFPRAKAGYYEFNCWKNDKLDYCVEKEYPRLSLHEKVNLNKIETSDKVRGDIVVLFYSINEYIVTNKNIYDGFKFINLDFRLPREFKVMEYGVQIDYWVKSDGFCMIRNEIPALINIDLKNIPKEYQIEETENYLRLLNPELLYIIEKRFTK